MSDDLLICGTCYEWDRQAGRCMMEERLGAEGGGPLKNKLGSPACRMHQSHPEHREFDWKAVKLDRAVPVALSAEEMTRAAERFREKRLRPDVSVEREKEEEAR